jgi:hypothetical protein
MGLCGSKPISPMLRPVNASRLAAPEQRGGAQLPSASAARLESGHAARSSQNPDVPTSPLSGAQSRRVPGERHGTSANPAEPITASTSACKTRELLRTVTETPLFEQVYGPGGLGATDVLNLRAALLSGRAFGQHGNEPKPHPDHLLTTAHREKALKRLARVSDVANLDALLRRSNKLLDPGSKAEVVARLCTSLAERVRSRNQPPDVSDETIKPAFARAAWERLKQEAS